LKRRRPTSKRPPQARRSGNDLPRDVGELQALVLELRQQVAYLTRMLFGRRSEKLPLDEPHQGLLFGQVTPQAPEETPGEDATAAEDEEPAPRRYRRRHPGRRALPEHLLRCVHDLHPEPEDLTCPSCGQAKTRFGEDVTEELELIPAKYFVNRYVRHKYACPHCQNAVSQGALPARPLDKGIPGPGFLADLVASKYSEHLPLYRLQERYRRANLEFSRSTLSEWVRHAAGRLAPVVELLKGRVRASGKVHTDDTPITVLDPTVKPVGSRRGYLWVYISDEDDVVFDYTDSHKRDGPASFLKGYRGYLQADAFSGYDGIYAGGDIIEVACWAHARRKYYDTLVHYPTEAGRVLELIGRLYAVESRAKVLGVPDEQRLAWRQHFSRRRLARLREYLDQLAVQVLPKSPLGKAITYTLKNWKALNRYTEHAKLAIDNNHSERQIKQLVMGRKAWLFAGSEAGARNAAILFSVVVSCKLAGVDPFAYLKDVLRRILTHPADRRDELLPREWKKHFGPGTASADSSAAA
jgi:transposase